jgi:hypothetical protein
MVDNPPSLHRFLYAFSIPTRYLDGDGHAPTEIGYVYVLRGFDPLTGEPVTYTGSTMQELRQRFRKHEWKALYNAESTTIDVEKVPADIDVEASNRGTVRSAKMEALRSREEVVRQQVEKEPSRPLNKVRAAAEENVEAWRNRHNVGEGETVRVKTGTKQGPNASTVTETASGSASVPAKNAGKIGAKTPKVGATGGALVFTGLALIDAYKMARQYTESGYVMAPYLLEDEGGIFTLRERTFPWDPYEKEYVSGEAAGTTVEIDKQEYYDFSDEARALWGYLDWKNEWVPGKLRKELPVINDRMREY